jgi:hypothetical protein
LLTIFVDYSLQIGYSRFQLFDPSAIIIGRAGYYRGEDQNGDRAETQPACYK